jgi:vacuolar-type H+-ATPase subunit E/Vma4
VKVEGLLQAAREAGEEITASARQEAEESTARAKAEAAELLVDSSTEAERVRAEADELLAHARAEADEAIARAKVEANRIVSEASAEAQNMIERSQAEADERFRTLEEALAALRDQAETRMRELETDTNAIWQQRRELLDNLGAMASTLLDLAKTAAERQLAQPPSDIGNSDAGGEIEPPPVTPDDTTRLIPAAVRLPPGESEADGKRAEPATSEPDN